MQRIDATLSEEQRQWVKRQAEQRDRTEEEILRAAVDLARGEPSPLAGEERTGRRASAGKYNDELREQINVLERRARNKEE